MLNRKCMDPVKINFWRDYFGGSKVAGKISTFEKLIFGELFENKPAN